MEKTYAALLHYNGSCWKISIASEQKLQDLRKHWSTHLNVSVPLTVKYEDEDGDRISITSDLELQEALLVAARRTLKLYLEADQNARLSHAPFVPFTQDALGSLLPQFLEATPKGRTVQTTIDPNSQLFNSFAQLLSAVPREQLAQIVSGLITSPLVQDMLSQLLASFSSVPLVPVDQSKQTRSTKKTVHNATCNNCKKVIVGVRYKCSTCSDFCEEMEAIHPEHLFLKLRQDVVINKETVKSKLDSLDAQIVGETMTSPSTVQSGNSFTKFYKLKNTGSLSWPKGTRLIRESGDFFGLNSLEVPPVQPNAEVELVLGLSAPTEPGRYLSHWTLTTPSNEKFGPMVWVDVMVDARTDVGKDPQPEQTNMTTSLKQLQDMGFTDVQKNLSLLGKHNGNVLQVVHELLTLEISK